MKTLLARVAVVPFVLAACTPRPPGATNSTSSSGAASSAPSPAASQPSADGTAWEGVLAEYLPSGIVYINDANARDSTAAFEAVLIPVALLAATGESVPARGQPWSPTIHQVLEAGQRIAAYSDQHAPANTPLYRYRLAAFVIDGKPLIRATALCEKPAWWRSQLASSRLCHAVGSCGHGREALLSARRDCSYLFEYDPVAGRLRRLDG